MSNISFAAASFISLLLCLTACGGKPPADASAGADSAPAQVESTATAAQPGSDQAATAEAESASAESAAVAVVSQQSSLAEVVSLYQKTCLSCHMTGASGAPRTHDTAAWAPRMAKGDEALLASIHGGLNAMPPKGLCFDCTDEQYLALTYFMSQPKPE